MKILYLILASALLTACAVHAQKKDEPKPANVDLAVLWAEHSAEYQAVSAQVFAQARRDLPRLLADPTWTALPGVTDVEGKPPAIVLDIDATAVIAPGYQATLRQSPHSRFKHFDWMRKHRVEPVRGAAGMIAAAHDAGVEVIFLTNRACETFDGVEGDCPAEQVAIDNLREVGIETDAAHILMAWEEPGWNKEKLSRRTHIAETYRVIMLFGDDLQDFVECSRKSPLPPCSDGATRASRHAAMDTYAEYWGNGWYIVPNPMHGSWTTVR